MRCIALGLGWMRLRANFGGGKGESGSHAAEGVCDGRTVGHHEVGGGKVYVLQPRREGRRHESTTLLTCPGLSVMRSGGSGEAMLAPGGLQTIITSVAFGMLGGDINILLFESTPGGENLVESVRGTKFERVAQKAQFLLRVRELGLAPELETGHPADFLGVVQVCVRYVRRRAELRYSVDHRFARLKGLFKILCLEGGVRNHGQCFHARHRGISKTKFIDKLQDHFFVFVGVIVARKDARNQRQTVLCEADLNRGQWDTRARLYVERCDSRGCLDEFLFTNDSF